MKVSSLIQFGSVLKLILAAEDATAHGTELKEQVPEGLTWQQWHMKEEHGVDDGIVDPATFFQMHDFGKRGTLDRADILTIYGLARDEVVGDGDGLGKHDNSEGISQAVKDEVVAKILYLMDADGDGEISLEEFLKYSDSGNKEFPDVGTGVGHHLSFEEEYEQHHWNKFHRDQDPDVKNVHKEDVEHELLHHEHELEHGEPEGFVTDNKDGINQVILENIPAKYLS